METEGSNGDTEAAMLLLGLFGLQELSRTEGSSEDPAIPVSDLTISVSSNNKGAELETVRISPRYKDSVSVNAPLPHSHHESSISLSQSLLAPAAQSLKEASSVVNLTQDESAPEEIVPVTTTLEQPTLHGSGTKPPRDLVWPDSANLGQPPKGQPSIPHFMGYDNQLYRCICLTTIEPEEGTSIQCEGCLAWQHAGCFGLTDYDLEGESYFCHLCNTDKIVQSDQKYLAYITALAKGKMENIQAAGLDRPSNVKEVKHILLGATTRGKPRKGQTGVIPKSNVYDRNQVPALPAVSQEHGSSSLGRTSKKKSNGSSKLAKPKLTSIASPPPLLEWQSCNPLEMLSMDGLHGIHLLEYTPVKYNINRGKLPDTLCAEHGRRLVLAQPTDKELPSSATQENVNLMTVSQEQLHPPTEPRAQHDTVPISVRVKNVAYQDESALDDTSKQDYETCERSVFGVHVNRHIEEGAFIGQYLGEIYSAQDYRDDPSNQYTTLGLTKPFVQLLQQPYNLVVDARRYGNNLRFIRHSCQPNVILRLVGPIDEISSDVSRNMVEVGVFAISEIQEQEELFFAWGWRNESTVRSVQEMSPISVATSNIDVNVSQVLSLYGDCPCPSRGTCAWLKVHDEAGVGRKPRSSYSILEHQVDLNGVTTSNDSNLDLDSGRVLGSDDNDFLMTTGQEESYEILPESIVWVSATSPFMRGEVLQPHPGSPQYSRSSDHDSEDDVAFSMLKGRSDRQLLGNPSSSSITLSIPLSESGESYRTGVLRDETQSDGESEISETSTLTQPLSPIIDQNHIDNESSMATINASISSPPEPSPSLLAPFPHASPATTIGTTMMSVGDNPQQSFTKQGLALQQDPQDISIEVPSCISHVVRTPSSSMTRDLHMHQEQDLFETLVHNLDNPLSPVSMGCETLMIEPHKKRRIDLTQFMRISSNRDSGRVTPITSTMSTQGEDVAIGTKRTAEDLESRSANPQASNDLWWKQNM